MNIFENIESEVQSYARLFPVLFERAEGVYLYDDTGKRYLDFLAGAGTLNYGHNHPALKEALLDYIENDGIAHGLDFHTTAKERFLQLLQTNIFEPRGLSYRVQFTGPTGTNAVEAALKLARNVTGRHNVVSFTNGFHGVSLGAMAATGNSHHRNASGIPLAGISTMPFDDYLDGEFDSVRLIRKLLDDGSSGIDKPAAFLLETVQGEGGLNTASIDWLRAIEKTCKERDILLIVDDIQAGCGRTGSFFSFEPAGIKPDIVTLSKSLSGFGLPFAVTLFKPELDEWKPGEHNGTFRGNNHAFVTAAKAIEEFWSTKHFAQHVKARSAQLSQSLEEIAQGPGSELLSRKGRGLMQGLDCSDGDVAREISSACFERGLVIETCGSEDEVIKCLCPLIISEQELADGLAILKASTEEFFRKHYKRAS